MKPNELRTVAYDKQLQLEAYRFAGIVQPFPNHFHEHYVLCLVEQGQRTLCCKNREPAFASVRHKKLLHISFCAAAFSF